MFSQCWELIMKKKNTAFGAEECEASLTVEAALVVPMFFFAIMALCSLFVYMKVYSCIGSGMAEAARKISPYGDAVQYVTERLSKTKDITGSGIYDMLAGDSQETVDPDGKEALQELLQIGGKTLSGAAFARAFLEPELRKYPLIDSSVRGGISGISFKGSSLLTEDECLIFSVCYELKPPVGLFNLKGIEVRQTLKYRYFTGHRVASLLVSKPSGEEETPQKEETVYITETGKVYHVSLTCPNLKVVIREVTYGKVGAERNEAGGKYYPCEKCAKGNKPENLYITADGDRYHYDLKCSGLKRSIKEVRLSEAEGRRKCKRCVREDKK